MPTKVLETEGRKTRGVVEDGYITFLEYPTLHVDNNPDIKHKKKKIQVTTIRHDPRTT